MLLPEQDFLDELYAPTLDGMLSLKERWGVSVGAMIMRCKSLGILDEPVDELHSPWVAQRRAV
jgi:Zn-dependent peptidase ImmA (M78 family)